MASFARRAGCAAAALLVSSTLSCSPPREDREPGARVAPSAVISDQVHNDGVPGFFWLPPMAPSTTYGGFEPGLSPEVVIERLPVGVHPPVARFVASEVRTDGESHYKVNWDTKATNLDPTLTYRIRVVLGWFELGFADVDVVASGSELRDVERGEYIPLLDGRTLPIKFRIGPESMLCPRRGPCEASDQCHLAGTCDPSTGECSNPAKPDGVACSDEDACTRSDTCRSGACLGADPVICEASDRCHVAGTCDRATGVCSNPAQPDGTPCNDGDLCTQVDTCEVGACVGAEPVACTALDQCHDAGVCEPLTGLCPDPAKPDGAACNDGNACTQADTCQVGECVGAEPVVCTALTQCHVAGACDPATGLCSSPEKPEGTPCSDANACTRADACRAGGDCVGADPVVCTALSQCHDAGVCVPATGLCTDPTKPNGSACDDANACTVTDACDGGACVGSGALDCDDGRFCTEDGCDEASGCVHLLLAGREPLPEETPRACVPPPVPPPTVEILGFSAAGELAFHAAQRLSFAVTLHASGGDRADYEIEFVLFPLQPPPATTTGETEGTPGLSIGTWRIPLVTLGEGSYWVEVAIPGTLEPGEYAIAAHEYPNSLDFVESAGVLVVSGPPQEPVLDLAAIDVAQVALFVDADSTVPSDPTVPRDAPFAASVDLVGWNWGATLVPLTAHVEWNDGISTRTTALQIWDPAARRWVETLVVPSLEADEPTGVFLELALAEDDAKPIRDALGAEPLEAMVVVTVNGDGSVPEAACGVIEDPSAPVNCRHTAEATALLYAAPPPPPEQAARFATMSTAAAGEPLTYRASWSKSIGNQWAGAGIAFKGEATLSSRGYEAFVEGRMPLSVFRNSFDLAYAKAGADALLDSPAHAGFTVSFPVVGYTLYDRHVYATDGNEVEIVLASFPFVKMSKEYEKFVILYIVPVTFRLGAEGTFELRGSLRANLDLAATNSAGIFLTGGPHAEANAFGMAGLGSDSIFGAFAGVTLTLVEGALTAEAGGTLTVFKDAHGTPLYLEGGLLESLGYELTFLSGRVGLVVFYPTIRWCRITWWLKLPCGFRMKTAEQTFCSWPGFGYEGTFLDASQPLFRVDLPCEPTTTCLGQCGTIYDGCKEVDCGGCPPNQTCGGDGVPNVCGGCTPTVSCDGLCGSIYDGCETVDCGGCPPGQVCGQGGSANLCGVPPPCSDPGDYLDTCGTCIHRYAEPPVLLYSDPVDRFMRDYTHVPPEDPNCADFDLPTSILVEEAAYAIQAATLEGYSSSAWVYFPDADGIYHEGRYIETYPSGTGIVEGTKVFDPPIPVRRVHICSWWNPAYLRRLDLFGDPAACAP